MAMSSGQFRLCCSADCDFIFPFVLSIYSPFFFLSRLKDTLGISSEELIQEEEEEGGRGRTRVHFSRTVAAGGGERAGRHKIEAALALRASLASTLQNRRRAKDRARGHYNISRRRVVVVVYSVRLELSA